MIILDFVQLIVWGATISNSFRIWDIFELYINLFITLDFFLNWWLASLIGEYGPQGGDCIYGYSMPAPMPELLTMYIMIYVWLSIMRMVRVTSWYNVMYIYGLGYLVVMCDLYRMVLTAPQTLAGVAVGFIESIVAVSILCWVVQPMSQWLENKKWYQWLGIKNRYFGSTPWFIINDCIIDDFGLADKQLQIPSDNQVTAMNEAASEISYALMSSIRYSPHARVALATFLIRHAVDMRVEGKNDRAQMILSHLRRFWQATALDYSHKSAEDADLDRLIAIVLRRLGWKVATRHKKKQFGVLRWIPDENHSLTSDSSNDLQMIEGDVQNV
jgi:hypothetical protein